jgi:hypothetical protein
MTRQQADESDQSPLERYERIFSAGCATLVITAIALVISAIVVAIGYGAVWAWSCL